MISHLISIFPHGLPDSLPGPPTGHPLLPYIPRFRKTPLSGLLCWTSRSSSHRFRLLDCIYRYYPSLRSLEHLLPATLLPLCDYLHPSLPTIGPSPCRICLDMRKRLHFVMAAALYTIRTIVRTRGADTALGPGASLLCSLRRCTSILRSSRRSYSISGRGN